MKLCLILGTTLLLLFHSCKDNPAENENESDTWINIVDLIPESQAVVNSNDTIKVELSYSISDEIQSDYGFRISIKFVSTTEGQTFSLGDAAQVEISQKQGTVSLNYPLNLVWNYDKLRRPISFYFYLHKMTSETSSTVIAKTEEIIYNED
jgi:hypothetical protein